MRYIEPITTNTDLYPEYTKFQVYFMIRNNLLKCNSNASNYTGYSRKLNKPKINK